MKRHSTLPALKRFIAFAIFAIAAVSVSAQVYYMNVYDKNGNRTRFQISDLDSVSLSVDKAPIAGLEYVDLGLSVKWASMNVGATNPFEAGDYFAWGETQPKNTYTLDTYKFKDQNVLNGYTKYNLHAIYGAVDYKYRLDMEDDAARANWGGDWRMPTFEEMQELVNLCDWEWVDDTLKLHFTGYKVTGPNGNFIYLPLAQYRNDENQSGSSNYETTSYLSASLFPGDTWSAAGLDIDYQIIDGQKYYPEFGLYQEGRCFGELVRPVYSWKAPENIMQTGRFDLKEKTVTLSVGESYNLKFDMDTASYVSPVVTINNSGLGRSGNYGIVALLPGTYTVNACLGEQSVDLTVTVPEPQVVSEAVDLGLSVKWATTNLGAETPSQYGFYYAWGETEPKGSFVIGRYKYYDAQTGKYTKYVTDSESGTVDGKSVLDLEDDAAHALWGDSWRMPTLDEYYELSRNCNWELVTVNGVKGYKVTSLVPGYTDNYIFLPMAGYGSGYSQGNAGYYWSSSLTTVNDAASGLYLMSATNRVTSFNRYTGRTIRPVQAFGSADVDTLILDESKIQLATGSVYQMGLRAYTATGKLIAVEGVIWGSVDETVATVDNGVITAVGEGFTIIRVALGNKMVECMVTVNDPDKPYVDLGLSVKWATCNIGAATPEDFGNYYAWGETETKNCYNDTTYKWYDVNTKTYSKYNFIPENGTVDLKYRLDPDDDVAYKVLGEGWRLPTYEEFVELIGNCSVSWVDKDTVYGYEFTSRINGNSIFLPLAGYMGGYKLYDAGNYGTYMSSSLNINATDDYNVLCLEDTRLRKYFRFSGYTVRAVYSSTFADNVLQVRGMTLSDQAVSLETGQQVELKATIDCDTTVVARWTSDNPAVARVDNNGVIVGVSAGECVVTASFAGLSQSCTVTVTEGTPLIESVDLGLSVMWATANVGASRVEDFGGYYAWGETEQKASYDWENYSWADASNPDNPVMTKYNAADGKIVLDPDDDVAHVKWQGEWRMPTRAEFVELFDMCEWEDSVQLNGVWGRTATGPNGNSIFMPYAGFYVGSECLYDYGSEYATSSLVPTNVSGAYVADYEIWSTSRMYGFSVRPVRPYAANEISGISIDKDTLGMLVGGSGQLSIKEQITGTVDAQWISADESVATVQDGLVTALSAGTTQVVLIVGNFKDTCVVNVIEPTMVNLGLSVNWATFNLGAFSPSECGDYYSWGETAPKSTYTWNTYAFGLQGAQTKYAMKVDGKTILDADDDAVKATWGGNWRMPTNKEFAELYDNCTWEWTTLNGVVGYIVTSKVQGYEGNYIFLPAAGMTTGLYPRYIAEYGLYWTSTMDPDNSDDYSFYFELGPSYGSMEQWYKYIGMSIRPVCPNPDYVPAEDPVVLTDNITIVVNDYENGVRRSLAEPRIVADPADATNNCIVVTTNADPTAVYNSEFIVTINDELKVGDQVTLSMRVKADKYQSSGQVVAQTAPGEYAGGAPFRAPSFDTRWYSYEWPFRVTNPDVNTYAFSLSYLNEGNNIYFDNISVTVVDTWTGELVLNKNELSLNIGSSAYQLSANDNVGTPYNDFAQWSSSDETVATVDRYGNVTAVSEGTATITATFRESSATCVVTVVPYEPVTDYVDLGLSVNWATCNLGALTPYDAGFHYAWAETASKQEYSWSTYSYCENGDEYSLTKYVIDANSGGYNGFYDGLAKLAAADDPATSVMGGNWRTATASEFEELINNCEWDFMYADDGTAGYKITSRVEGYEDQYIFLPINGFKTGTKLSDKGSSGYYWTSSLSTSYNSTYALNLAFSTYGGMGIGMDYRSYGMGIRPVMPNQNYVDKVIISDNVTVKVKDYVNGEILNLVDPRIVTDPDNAYNQCIVVTTQPNPSAVYSQELFITISDELLLGQMINLSLRYKADKYQAAGQTIGQSAPGVYVSGNPFRYPDIQTDWTTLRVAIPVTNTDINTYAFSLSYLSEGNNIYFDDISATVSDSYSGGLYIDGGDFTMETGSSATALYLYDRDYDSFGNYATWTSSNENVATVDNKGAVTPVGAGTATITATFRGESASVTVTVSQYEPVTDYVDLGLSVNWATCNIGAYTPEEAGYHYAWGELATSNNYTWSDYSYYVVNEGGLTLTKYTDSDGSSSTGQADNLYVLQTADDVAAQLMGGNWRMATADEFNELLNNCDWEAVKDKDGNFGYRITSRVEGYTDKSIFLPANGYRMDGNYYSDQMAGFYWTSTLTRNDGSASAQNLYFDTWGGTPYVTSYRRYTGMAIRPVFPNENYVDKIYLSDNFTVKVKEYPEGELVTNASPRQVADPANALNQCLVVTTNTNPSVSYDAQLFINLNEALAPGMQFTVSMRIKADKAQNSEGTVLDSHGEYITGFSTWNFAYFETSWTTFTKTIDVTRADTKSFALNVSTLDEGNNVYFDDIMVTVKDIYGGNLSLNESELSLDLGAEGYSLIATDGDNTEYTKYAQWTSSNENVATVDNNGKVTAVGVGTATITAQFRDDVATCAVTVKEYEPVTDVVDLGLSVKWATCNVGSSLPQGVGFYFAWAETDPKSEYTWDNYAYCENGDEYQLTKYTFEDYSSYSGVADDLIVLEQGDDAAAQVLGGSFRTATAAEFEELINLCTWKTETFNGTYGYRITSKVPGYEENSIFIPANGYKTGDEHSSGNWYYWSSSLDLYGKSCYAQFLHVGSSWYSSTKPEVSSDLRLMGMGVRPVVTSDTWQGITSVTVEDQVSLTQYDYYNLNGALWSGNTDYSFMADELTWTSSDEDVVTVDDYGQILAVAAGEATITVTYKNLSADCAVTVSAFSYQADGTENNHGYVDLGLSVNWATFNLGATSLTGFGDYYAWAEVEPYYADGYAQEYDAVWNNGKSYGYAPESNRYYASEGYQTQPGWTKYCQDPQCGKDEYEDNLKELASSDDAASANWGGSWRMPYNEEFEELQNNCEWIWITLNGVEGFKVVSNVPGYEGKFIFLPSAGNRYSTDYYEDGGMYWSKTLDSSWPESAYSLCFSYGYGYIATISRSQGMSVRAVCPKE